MSQETTLKLEEINLGTVDAQSLCSLIYSYDPTAGIWMTKLSEEAWEISSVGILSHLIYCQRTDSPPTVDTFRRIINASKSGRIIFNWDKAKSKIKEYRQTVGFQNLSWEARHNTETLLPFAIKEFKPEQRNERGMNIVVDVAKYFLGKTVPAKMSWECNKQLISLLSNQGYKTGSKKYISNAVGKVRREASGEIVTPAMVRSLEINPWAPEPLTIRQILEKELGPDLAYTHFFPHKNALKNFVKKHYPYIDINRLFETLYELRTKLKKDKQKTLLDQLLEEMHDYPELLEKFAKKIEGISRNKTPKGARRTNVVPTKKRLPRPV